jgi:hypothetical protein
MQGAANAGGAISSGAKQVAGAVTNPIETSSKIGESAGTTLGNMAKNANTAKQAINKGVDAVSHPGRTLNNAAQKTSDTAKEAASGMKERFQQAFEHAKNTDSKGDNQQA